MRRLIRWIVQTFDLVQAQTIEIRRLNRELGMHKAMLEVERYEIKQQRRLKLSYYDQMHRLELTLQRIKKGVQA